MFNFDFGVTPPKQLTLAITSANDNPVLEQLNNLRWALAGWGDYLQSRRLKGGKVSNNNGCYRRASIQENSFIVEKVDQAYRLVVAEMIKQGWQ